MPVNTSALDDGKYVTTSALSLTGSGATLSVGSLTALGGVTANFLAARSGNTIVSLSDFSAFGARFGTAIYCADGTAVNPSMGVFSEQSLGLYRSAASTLAMSYGRFDLRSAGLLFSSGTTAQSASTAKVADGQLIPSVLSLTTNGAALYFRSGNSTYVWPSSGVIG